MSQMAKTSVAGWATLMREDRDHSSYGTLCVVLACLGVVATMLISGCSTSSQASPVNASLARESLKAALDHWKKGEDPSTLQSSAMAITAQDFEWASGAKLLDYQILDEGKEEAANLRVQVKISLGPKGKNKAESKTATYVVGTSPSVTVYRDIMKR